MESHLFRAHIEFGRIICTDSINRFLLKSAINIDSRPLEDNLLNLSQTIGMQLSYPKFSQNFKLLNFSAAFLHKQESKQIAIDLDDGVMDGLNKVGDFDEFVDNIDILEDGPFSLKLVDGFSNQGKHPHFNTVTRKTEQSLHEFTRLQYLNIPQVDVYVVHQLL